jgi:cellulose synthase/poly-beta-1,6-N-acetylglucosamine synthase-like glycosyltransferase
VVDDLEKKLGVRWRVLRRPTKGGGKSAVTNYVSEQTSDEHDFFLLADNDSFSHDPKLLFKAACLLDDDEVAVVQFRCVNEHRPDEGGFIRLLGGAVDMFDAFMTGLYRGLWQPFVGHNAVLRTRDLLEAGGFTPGVFADDIDLTVRMNRNGKQVVYRRDLEMGEYHPPITGRFASARASGPPAARKYCGCTVCMSC